jgi:hypothetical protein
MVEKWIGKGWELQVFLVQFLWGLLEIFGQWGK